MPTAQDMRKITEDIEVSYGARVAALSDLFKETQGTLDGFRQDRYKMADELRSRLSSENSAMVREFRGELKKMANELKEAAGDLGKFLSQSESQRRENFKTLLAEIHRRQKARDEELTAFLASFRESHKKMAAQTRGELTRSRKDLKKAVSDMLSAFKADRKQARSYWQNLIRVLSARRAGKAVRKVEVPKRVEVEAEKAIGRGELKARTLTLIRENPGINLAKLGKALKVPYITLAIPVSELVSEGRVKKEDNKYYPVA